MRTHRPDIAVTLIALVAASTAACARRAAPDDIGGIDAAALSDDCAAAMFAARDDAARSTTDGALCSSSGWCWEEPFPHGNAIESLWASGTSDAWAVTRARELLRWDGSRWRAEEPLTDLSPRAIGGFARDRLWMAGTATTSVLRAAFWNGMSWSGLQSLVGHGDNARVWHPSFDDAWIEAERIMHWEPNWRDRTPPGLVRPHLFRAGTTEFAYDDAGELRRWDGAPGWQSMPSPRDVDGGTSVPSVFGGTSASDVWAFARDPSTARHWDGTQWTSIATNISTDAYAIDLVASASGRLWLLGDDQPTGLLPSLWQFDGTAWSHIDAPPIFLPRLADTPTDAAWLYGTRGAVAIRDGSNWTEISGVSPLARGASWHSVGGVDDDNVWAVGTVPGPALVARIVRRDARGWHDDWRGDGSLLAIAANSVDDVWAAGSTSPTPSGETRAILVHWDGTAWNPVDVPITPAADAWRHIASRGPRDVWLAGRTVLAHFDGSSWSRVDIDGSGTGASYPYSDVSERAPDDVWVVGDTLQSDGGGSVIASHWDGTRWRSEHVVDFPPAAAGPPFLRIVAGAGDEAWILGTDRVWHRVGSTWTAETRFFAYVGWRGCSGDVWFASGRFVDHVADGVTSMTTGASDPAVAGWTSRAGTSWIVTGEGGILRRDAR